MDANYLPEFKKIDTFKDGKLCEVFFIDDKEVSEKTYYNLLEDSFGVGEYKTEKKPSPPTKKKSNNTYGMEKQDAELRDLIDLINSVDIKKGINLLASELLLQYRLGYHIAQVELCESFTKVMKHNSKLAKDSLNGLLDAYNVDI
jgi:hypothetical protein